MTKNQEQSWPASRVEVWKPIPPYPGYEASSYGRIRSVDRLNYFGKFVRKLKGKVLKTHPAGSKLQYLYVGLGLFKKHGVHRLVTMAFHGMPPSSLHEAAHWNGQSKDNRPDNLRWATPLENNHDMDRHGTRIIAPKPKGEAHHKAKLTNKDVKFIRRSITGERGELTALAHQFDIHRSIIAGIRDGKAWKHIH